MLPSIFEFTEDYVENVFGMEKNVLILFRDEEDGKADYWFTFKEAAFNHKNEIAFAYAGLTEPYGKTLMEFMRVTPEDFPVLTAIRPKDFGRFISPIKPSDHSVGSIMEFATSVKNETIEK